MAGKYKIRADQGATLRRTFTISTQGDTPVPWNLTGFTARMQVRTSIEDPTVVLEATTTNGRLAIGPNPGELVLVVSATDTDALAAGSYVYDLELVSPSGEVTRLLEGTLVVRRAVTR